MRLRYLRWPNTVLAGAQVLPKNKHGINTAIILFAQCSLYLYYFSSQMDTMY